MREKIRKKSEIEIYQKIFKDIERDIVIDSFEEEKGSEKGDNYTSQLYKVILHGHHRDNPEKIWRKVVFYKKLPESKARRETYGSELLFRNESFFYNEVLRQFKIFQHNFNVNEKDQFKSFPLCYFANADEIVLDDLTQRGFTSECRKKGLNINQLEAALTDLAKFHALSLAIRQHEPTVFDRFQENIFEGIFKMERKTWYKYYYGQLTQDAIQMVAETIPDKPDYIEKMRNFSKEFFTDFVNLLNMPTKLLVLCHGDLWTNNLMFRYDESKQVAETHFIDFQLMRFGSLTLDIIYMFYTSTDTKLRKEHMYRLLKLYHEELYKQLQMYPKMPEDVYGKDVLWNTIFEEYKKFQLFALYVAIDMLPIKNCEADEAPDVYEESEEENVMYAPLLGIPINETCKREMAEMLIEMVEEGVL